MGNNGGVQLIEVGQLPDKAATRYRLEWFASMKVQEPWHAAKLANVKVG